MIPLKTKGVSVNIRNHLVGRVTRNASDLDHNSIFIVENELKDSFSNLEFLCILTTSSYVDSLKEKRIIYKIPRLNYLENGDIVWVSTDGIIHTLYRVNSIYNTLLTTERCNSNCLMCSQPPRDRNDIRLLYEINSQAIKLIPKTCSELGISGGEPTLLGELFFSLMEQLKNELPDTEIHVLTNGRAFAWNHFSERLKVLDNKHLLLGIPVYSDYYQVHDYIVQAKQAFYQTILGLHNLARYEQRIELRVVLHKQSITRLARLSRYIYKNLPFVEHVAFMGLENIGYTPYNWNKLWIEPDILCNELLDSVEYLASQSMNVSIYNLPLCFLPKELWKYARKSISDWKNEFLPECERCIKKTECAGFFAWNLEVYKNYIQTITS